MPCSWGACAERDGTQLAKHGFFGGDDPSIADIALFAYTHVADQGGFELQKYPAITRWIDDMKSSRIHTDHGTY